MDKLSLAGLSTTLVHYLKDEASEKIPIWRMISATQADLKERAEHWAKVLDPFGMVIPEQSKIGGGSLPGEVLPTWVVKIDPNDRWRNVMDLARTLRNSNPPIVARVQDNQLLLDPRTVLPEQDNNLLKVMSEVIR